MNFRFMLILAVSLLISSSLATYVFVSQKLKFSMFIIILFIFAIFLVLSIIFRRKVLYVLAAILLFASMPFINLFLRNNNLANYLTYSDKEIIIYGRISENFDYSSGGSVKILLDNVTLYSDDNIEDLNGKILLYTNKTGLDVSKLDIGRFISVSGTFDFNKFTNDSFDIYYLNNDIIATAYVYNHRISFTNVVERDIKDNIKSEVYEILSDAEVKHKEIGYAMLFGDTTLIDRDVKSLFQETGIAHLLAVSGLHVSIIVMIIDFIIKKCKSPKWLEILILSSTLLFYAYLCDFSVSVIRAGLMAIFALCATARGKAYDNLSVLSMIASIILMIKPTEMFNVSFVLSFSAVISIILLAKPVERILSRVFARKFSETLALNIAVQCGLSVTIIYFFNRINPLGIICNLISVPIAVLAFVILIIGTLISLIFPFLSFVCLGYGYLMDIVVKFNAFISSLDLLMIIQSVSWIYILLVFAFEFIFSDYTFMKGETKVKLSMLALSICNLIVALI